jgi:hypothetical protein
LAVVWLFTIAHGPAHDLPGRFDRVIPCGLEIRVVTTLVVSGEPISVLDVEEIARHGGPRFLVRNADAAIWLLIRKENVGIIPYANG